MRTLMLSTSSLDERAFSQSCLCRAISLLRHDPASDYYNDIGSSNPLQILGISSRSPDLRGRPEETRN